MKDYQAYNNKLFARWAPIYDGFELIYYYHSLQLSILQKKDYD